MLEGKWILEARDVGVRYPNAVNPSLTDATVEISAGDTIGIVGESGSGKSTFARALAGAITPTQGTLTAYGLPWRSIPRRDTRRRRVQMVFQDPYASLNPFKSALDTVAEVYEVWDGVGRAEARRRAADELERVGLSSQFHAKKPRHLSGGQCQRIGIARALACDPDVLIADEPTSALDVSIQAQILNLLASLRQERGLAIVLVSHDLTVVRYLTETTLVLYGGEIVERGPTAELLHHPRHPYTDLLLASAPGSVRQPLAPSLPLTLGACVFTSRCARARTECVSHHPSLSAGDHAYRCHFPIPFGADRLPVGVSE